MKEFKLIFDVNKINSFVSRIETKLPTLIFLIMVCISIFAAKIYYDNGLSLVYNDARSHLNIGRRVVEGLKPGLSQLGSVWLPLPHILMVFTIWNDFMWHSGLSGAMVSMISFTVTALLIYNYLEKLNVSILGRIFGVFIFAANINILYLQSTAMTELLLLATMTYGAYEFMLWQKKNNTLYLIRSAIWIMLSTLTRYDGWFLLAWTAGLIVILTITSFKKEYFEKAEGLFVLFCTLGGFGVFLWLLWNALIFKDPFYFALGPFSAKAQQDQLEQAGVLPTKYNLLLSIKYYFYAVAYNSNAYIVVLGFVSSFVLWFDKKIPQNVRVATSALVAPFFFNVLALFMGHSVLFIQGLSGDTWFNVRYGIMMAPAFSIFIGYFLDKLNNLKWTMIGTILFVTFFMFSSQDAVTIDDARVGSSQKNVSEVSGWLKQNATNEPGFILVSAASHDAIIFSSGMPMKRFIHEGTGSYWKSATQYPDQWARWIIMRTHDTNDLTYKLVSQSEGFERYELVNSFPFADIYQIRPEFLDQLHYQADLVQEENQ